MYPSIEGISKGHYRHIGKNVVSAHPTKQLEMHTVPIEYRIFHIVHCFVFDRSDHLRDQNLCIVCAMIIILV